MSAKKKFTITEYVNVIRTYEVEAEDREDALNMVYGGKVAPYGYQETDSEMNIEEEE